ncbi:phosphatase PAP2 family protein [Shewanella sp. WXL01]|uniref:phosphatase PAP2 family protein n=1 Tax=Shewanella sp. WXL01 TaxID=2709721 RepID=UPI00143836FD|nr:phosphatase PAP2 family protein [Shewanella sp. WXL01]NKF49607.1 phosphatase PAP2 family protein [Shewanella sp. WXL01]
MIFKPNPAPIPFKRNYVLAYLFAALCVMLAIGFIDRPLASWLHQHSQPNMLFKLFSDIPVLLEAIAGAIIIGSLYRPWRERLKQAVLQLVSSLILATCVRVGAKMLFGRTWPETWINDNPSWISHGVEGFYPLTLEKGFHSFPSGHALFSFALASMLWRYFPKLAPVWITAMLATIAGQLGQNYHYLGDLLAGATLGCLLAHICSHVFNGSSGNKR